MAFSDEALAQRLRNLATDRELSGDSVGAKWMYEAAARLLELSNAKAWHPSLTTNYDKAIVEVIDFILGKPSNDEIR